jgi:hypothetical protein
VAAPAAALRWLTAPVSLQRIQANLLVPIVFAGNPALLA